VQIRDAILKGALPISVEYAVQFAGMQCQIQFSDHVETKHKPGFIEYDIISLSYYALLTVGGYYFWVHHVWVCQSLHPSICLWVSLPLRMVIFTSTKDQAVPQ